MMSLTDHPTPAPTPKEKEKEKEKEKKATTGAARRPKRYKLDYYAEHGKPLAQLIAREIQAQHLSIDGMAAVIHKRLQKEETLREKPQSFWRSSLYTFLAGTFAPSAPGILVLSIMCECLHLDLIEALVAYFNGGHEDLASIAALVQAALKVPIVQRVQVLKILEALG